MRPSKTGDAPRVGTASSCSGINLQGSDPNVSRNTSSQYGDHFCEIVLKSDFKTRSYGPDTILLQGRFCCDPNVASDTSSQYGNHFCEIVLKSDLRSQSFGLDTNSGRMDERTDNPATICPPPIFFGKHKNPDSSYGPRLSKTFPLRNSDNKSFKYQTIYWFVYSRRHSKEHLTLMLPKYKYPDSKHFCRHLCNIELSKIFM